MSGDIFVNIDSIVLSGMQHVDPHALTEALQQALIDQLSVSHELRSTDLSRVNTRINLPGDFSSTQLGQTLGQNLNDVINNSAPLGNLTVNSGHVGQRDA